MKPPSLFFTGSLPFTDPHVAVDFVKSAALSLPFLPQLPEANPQEDMIGQILRGFKTGFWDETASVCLPDFLEVFASAFRVKVQLAGPFTVASSISASFEEIAPQWLALATNVVDQFRSQGVQAEIWLQIDEPQWSTSRALPPNYLKFLQLAAAIDSATVLGLHSCAPNRPRVPEPIIQHCRFLSLAFHVEPMREDEAPALKKAVDSGKHLIAGVLPKEGQAVPVVGQGFPWGGERIWLSAPCGLSEWTEAEVDALAKSSRVNWLRDSNSP